jgi:predicted Ser/Thr protein kinase
MDMYTAAPPPRLPPGTRLNGMFEVDQRIASGGMGEIYRGHVVETGDPVAIKMMRLDLADNAMALALFRKEASALHNIHHEAIIRYYVFSHDPGVGRHYLAMEFVDGMPLSDLVQQGPLGLAAVRLLQERLAAGLNAAHQHGIIHRDLSPDNVLIPGHDLAKAKIIDFGIARSTRSGDGTIIGSAFAGKYNYVSPEQLGLYGGDVTARSDIYSLGLVLAACLLGRPLDMGGTQFEVLEKRRTVPDLTAIDRRFRPLLDSMLQPNPADRPESMAAVAAWRPEQGAAAAPRRAAARGRGQTVEAATSPVVPGSRRLLKAALVLVPVVVIALAVGLLWPGLDLPPPPPPPPPGLDDPRQRVIDFINAYDRGGDCFFISPKAVDKRTAAIDALGREGGDASLGPFDSLSAAFESFNRFAFDGSNRFEATIYVRQVRAAQCPAVDFLHQTRHARDTAPRLDVAARLKDGLILVAGSVSKSAEGGLGLLLVLDNGNVYNLASKLTRDGATQTFEQDIDKRKPGRVPLLLIVVASPQPLNALRLPADGALAAQVFPEVQVEAAQTRQTLRVRAEYFILEE